MDEYAQGSAGKTPKVNPLLSIAEFGLGGLADYFGGMEQRKQQKWGFDQRKDLYNMLRWGGNIDKPVVSQTMLNTLQNRNYDALAPVRSNMSYAAPRCGGARSGQMQNMFAQNYFPIAAQTSNQNQQWAVGLNEQRRQYILNLLSQLTGG